MTAPHLDVFRRLLQMSDTSASNLDRLKSSVSESPGAFSFRDPNEISPEGPIKTVLSRESVISASENRSRSQSESFASNTSLPTPDSTTHNGEIARGSALGRIGELKECAQEEQISIDQASQWDLIKFISGYVSEEDLNIFLLDNGKFHVIWKISDSREVGIEFLGEGHLKKTVVTGSLATGAYSASSESADLNVYLNLQ
jgi:hypothetical protein